MCPVRAAAFDKAAHRLLSSPKLPRSGTVLIPPAQKGVAVQELALVLRQIFHL